ncbi:MAG TPA: HAD family hydrolase [Tetragenococcus sp.]|nr:HAD family hydrolase [Tetragenococcus sp.]
MARIFHQTFDPEMAESPTAFDSAAAFKRAAFKAEELLEFLAASAKNKSDFVKLVEDLHTAIDQAKEKILRKEQSSRDPLVEQVDALADLLYFTYGSFALMNVDPNPIMEIVHQANMAKLFPDGKPHYHPQTKKVLKPENWQRDFAPEIKIKKELLRQENSKN